MVSMDQFYRLNGIVQRLILYIAFFPPFPYHLHIYRGKIPNSVIVPEKEKREKKETKKNSNFVIKLQQQSVKFHANRPIRIANEMLRYFNLMGKTPFRFTPM